MTLEAVQVGDHIGSKFLPLFSGYVTAIGEFPYGGHQIAVFWVRRPDGTKQAIARDDARIIEE
jgi:hypothetical protein